MAFLASLEPQGVKRQYMTANGAQIVAVFAGSARAQSSSLAGVGGTGGASMPMGAGGHNEKFKADIASATHGFLEEKVPEDTPGTVFHFMLQYLEKVSKGSDGPSASPGGGAASPAGGEAF
ncbi:hypothetical protein VP01_382g3 [Puccinia sorghi]|uniref:Uncharacterized protein n=1 Tax=Puccinia sorghi TaxID=27349 RepID=A0A0L6UT68_9BASI|nr:hypothetical protein VP01_382g3 [Puccinia sorghi]